MSSTKTFSIRNLQFNPLHVGGLNGLLFDELILSEFDDCTQAVLENRSSAVPLSVLVHEFDLTNSIKLVDFELLSEIVVSETDVKIEASSSDIDELVGEIPLTSVTYSYAFDSQQQTIVETYVIAFPHIRIFGMSYADKYWQEFPNPEAKAEEEKRTAAKRNGVIPREQQKRKRKSANNAPKTTFWDLIYVLLKPPLTLGDTSSLYLPHRLYPYQITGVNFLMSGESSLLADDMGTGKTVMTIVALRVLAQQGKIRRVLIVCPPSVLYEWRRHLLEWSPDFVSVFVRGTKPQRSIDWASEAHIYVTPNGQSN